MLGLWQLLADVGVIDPFIASSPTRIVDAGVELAEQGTLFPALASPARLFALSFAIALVSWCSG